MTQYYCYESCLLPSNINESLIGTKSKIYVKFQLLLV